MGLLLDVMQFQFLSTVFVYKECADISYFDFDLKNTTMILWTDNFITDTVS
jgi:hypothetical protein